MLHCPAWFADVMAEGALQSAASLGLKALPAECELLVHALRTQCVPSLGDLLLALKNPLLWIDNCVPRAPCTPGFKYVLFAPHL
jgi:hypothetical protein